MKRDVKLIYTAVNADAARAALDELAEKWGKQYGAVIRLWENAWEQFIPFLDYDPEIRTVICSTNAIESLNARYRRAVKARGHFPTEQAAIKCLYLVTRSLDPTGTGRTRWTMRWLSRHGARCRHCCRSVSPCRSPNPACASRRTGLSTASAVRRGSPSPGGGDRSPVSVAGDRDRCRVEQLDPVHRQRQPPPEGVVKRRRNSPQRQRCSFLSHLITRQLAKCRRWLRVCLQTACRK